MCTSDSNFDTELGVIDLNFYYIRLAHEFLVLLIRRQLLIAGRILACNLIRRRSGAKPEVIQVHCVDNLRIS